ncbi:MAG: hypothetical protein N3B13_11815, partial [Deltaproteobacteria bacterium]|nr:hypothetical protein [Deltaproteobacteria bacterium]
MCIRDSYYPWELQKRICDETLNECAKRGIRITEVPIRYRARSYREGKKIGMKDLIRTVYCIVKYNL